MNFVKTPDLKGLTFSPLELRPGTTAEIAYSYVARYEGTWNSDLPTEVAVSGMTWETAVETDWPVDRIDIAVSGVWSTVSLDPIYHGPIDLAINYKIETSDTVTSVSAINENGAVYYEDWYYDEEGVATPLTVLPLTLPTNVQIYKPEDFDVTFSQPERGVGTIDGDEWSSNSVGTLKLVDNKDDFSKSWNMFRKGVKEVLVPMACTIEPVVRYDLTGGVQSGKWVEMDIQEWYPQRMDIRGILWHRNKLYVLTDSGMFSFDRWGDFSTAENEYPTVTGYDLTYAAGDKFLVTDGSAIKVYKVRHDYQHYDRNTDVLRFREEDPTFSVEE